MVKWLFHLGQLAKVKSFASQHHFEILIHAFITTCLDHCNALCVGFSQSRCRSLYLLPLRLCIDFEILLFLNVFVVVTLPEWPAPSLPYILGPQVGRSNFVSCWFSAAAPELWSHLPLHIRQTDSLPVLKRLLKTHFFSLAFNPVGEAAFYCLSFLIIVCFYCIILKSLLLCFYICATLVQKE